MIAIEKDRLIAFLADTANDRGNLAYAEIITLPFGSTDDHGNVQCLCGIGNGPYAIQCRNVEMTDGNFFLTSLSNVFA